MSHQSYTGAVADLLEQSRSDLADDGIDVDLGSQFAVVQPSWYSQFSVTADGVRSAIAFHFETFGPDALDMDQPVLEAFIAETRFAV